MNHQISGEQLEELQMSSDSEYLQIRVYKVVSRPGVNESLERDFIKMILTKDQE